MTCVYDQCQHMTRGLASLRAQPNIVQVAVLIILAQRLLVSFQSILLHGPCFEGKDSRGCQQVLKTAHLDGTITGQEHLPAHPKSERLAKLAEIGDG